MIANSTVLNILNSAVFNQGGLIGTLANLGSGTISGVSVGVHNENGTIGTLTNSGTITASNFAGIYNQNGLINSLTNNVGGTIVGGTIGIANGAHRSLSTFYGSIGTLTNNGLVSGGQTGVYNLGSIGTLSNAGIIQGSTYYGVYNAGSISVLANSDLIAGSFDGVYNNGSVNALTNSGTITGFYVGIYNGGSIGTITNNGLITDTSANNEAIYNTGTIGVLSNLAAGRIIGGSYGIYNYYGSIGTLSNSGTIAGTNYDGVYNYYGTIGALTNSNVISGGYYGVLNEYTGAVIGTLANNAGGVIHGGYTGAHNFGSIASFTNSGTISGTTFDGIYNVGTITGLTNNAGGTIIGGNYGVANTSYIATRGSIVNLTNNGVITGTSYTGVYNSYVSTIGQLTNNGTIAGYDAGVGNWYSASIGTLANNAGGTILGHLDGINNEYGASISQLTNSGSIVGLTRNGIYNYQGSIATLSNNIGGMITGYNSGIYNSSGTISDLTNSGSIIGAHITGIDNNGGLIGTLTNSGVIAGVYGVGNNNSGTILSLTNNAGGTISGANTGIYNYGNMPQLTNNDIISGGGFGVYDSGPLGTLTNSGTISGTTGIYIRDAGTTIVNMGTIASTNGGNAIDLENNSNSLILNTGSVLVGTIYGGNYNNSITLEGTDSMSNTIASFGAGSTLTVATGADWAASGSWTIPNVTNNGTFEPGFITGNGTTSTPLTLNGNFTMGSGGTYVVLVTPATSSQFNVVGNGTTTGVATLTGTVKYVFAPGIYGVKTYTYLTASAPVTTTFNNVVYSTVPNVADLTTHYNVDPSVVLSILTPFSVSLPDQSIFSEQQQALAQSTQNATGTILDKATEGGSNANPACAVQAPAQTQMAGGAMGGMAANGSQIANTLASVFCGRGGWIEATGSLGHVDASNGAPAYDNNSAGFLAGVDTPVGAAGTRLGFAVGFDQSTLSDKAGGSGNLSTTRIALYGSQPLGSFTLAGVVGYGFASNKTTRSDGLGNSFNENNSVGIFNAGLQGSTHVELGSVDIAPAAGIKIASVNGTNFSENTSGLLGPLAVAGRLSAYTSVMPYISARASETFITASNVVISPDLLVGFEYEAADRGRATNITFAGGVPTNYATTYNKLDAGDALISAGISASRNYWSLYATYTAHISGNWSDQTGEAGLRIKF
ncbi:MAG: autotransporter domain-containing protein [Acidocella sp.]|nr:autotransporter domain-containing protein [Acidocella sp.]